MKLPSVQHILSESSRSFKRFPFAIISAVIAAASAIYLTESDYGEGAFLIQKLLLISLLGISMFIVIVLTTERKLSSPRLTLAAQGGGVLLLLIYYFFMPVDIIDAQGKHFIRFILFFLGMHLLVAYLPFAGNNELNGFWQYNKSLFLRFLTAVLYSGVLFLGLSVALLSIDQLFGIEIREELYLELWIVLAFVFNTWFFLSGVPRNLNSLEGLKDYPTGLKVFTQYVLIPLVIIYLFILYGYTIKIMVEWQWPEGWVANLVLGFSIVGIFALLLLHPIRNQVEYRWIKSISRNYYITLLPLVILLLLAIWVRISEYSFTENRYFVLVAGLWLGVMALYFIFSRKKNIKVIPASLAAIVFLSSFGPWGAFSISENSQINRLEKYLTKNEILIEGRVRPAPTDVPFEDEREISAIFRYLTDIHGLSGIEPWFEQDSETWKKIMETEENSAMLPQKIVEELGLDYVSRWESEGVITRSFNASGGHPVPVDEYDWMVADLNLDTGRDTAMIDIGSETFFIKMDEDSAGLGLYRGLNTSRPLINLRLQPLIERLNTEYGSSNRYNIPPEEMTINAENDSTRIRLAFRYIQAQKSNETWSIRNLRLAVLFTFREV